MQKRRIVMAAAVAVFAVGLTGCGLFDSEVNELNGTIKGNTYNVSFYSNDGVNFMNMNGEKNRHVVKYCRRACLYRWWLGIFRDNELRCNSNH